MEGCVLGGHRSRQRPVIPERRKRHETRYARRRSKRASSILRQKGTGMGSVWSLEEAEQQCAAWHAAGKRIVFTNGHFDILHLGHVDYLQRARALGDALVVG
ncbi:MAG: adenylyltransferase/cytidyltransferase family protein, partial [Anaerolineae bacterium]